MIQRRPFLAGLIASLWAAPALAEVKILEINCPDRAFEETRRNLAKMQSEPVDDAEFIRRSRAWLGGPQIERSGPEWRAAGGVPLRVVMPEGTPKAVVMQLHGGGWITGNAASDRTLCEALARRCQVAVASVDYRLAPEHPFPAAIDDCLTAVDWLLRNAPSQFGCSRVALQGCSAGAHLAAMTMLGLGPRARQLTGAVLYYGVYDLGISPAARLAHDDDHPDLSTTSLRRMIGWFTPGLRPEQRQVAAISPLYAPTPSLPPTLFVVGGADILLDDSLNLSQKWGEKNEVELALWPGAPHGFNMFNLEGVENSLDVTVDFLQRLLG